jgi:hypothetical protein
MPRAVVEVKEDERGGGRDAMGGSSRPRRACAVGLVTMLLSE